MGKFSSSDGELSKAGKCSLIFLVIINILFIILGVITLAIGAYAIANGDAFSFVTGSTLIGGSAILIIVGIAIVLVASFGFLAAVCRSRVLLGIYAIVLFVIVLAQIGAGAAAFYYRNEIGTLVQEGIQENLIENYDATNPSDGQNTVVDFFQQTFDCCGFVNASDWVNLNLDAILESGNRPPRCLDCIVGADNPECATFYFPVNVTVGGITLMETRDFNTTDVGCATVNSNTLLGLYIGAGVVGIIFGILEIIGVLLALFLICCISRSKEQTVV